ncbi:MAG: hypothetical protein ACK50L_01110 [Bacteroidota bacterium]
MKKIILIFILGIVTFSITNCSRNNSAKGSEKCDCDSMLIEKSSFYKKYSCFFNDKKITIKKSLNDDTVEIKKYYLTIEGRYQKCEYLTLIKNKIDYDQSAFVDININKGYANITLSSNDSLQNIYIILDNYSLSNKGNHVRISLDSLKTISIIQKQTDKLLNNDSIKKITQIVDYFYTFKDITEEKTLMKQYNRLIQCGIIK